MDREIIVPASSADRAAAVTALAGEAEMLHDAGRHEDAVQLLQRWAIALEDQQPDDKLAEAELHTVLGWAMHRSADEHAAERLLTLAFANSSDLEEDPDEPGRLNRLLALNAERRAMLYLRVNHDAETARSLLLEALSRRGPPGAEPVLRARTLAQLGLADLQRGQLQTARVYLTHAVQDDRAAWLGTLAEVEEQLGDEDAAEAHLREALELSLASAQGHSARLAAIEGQLGAALLRWGSPIEAEIHLRHAVATYSRIGDALDSEAIDATLTLAHVSWALQKLDDAVKLAARATLASDGHLRHLLEMGGEELRARRAARTRSGLDLLLTMAWEHPDHELLATYAFDALLRRKALLADISAGQRAAQREQEVELSELDRLREQLSDALLAGERSTVQRLTAEIASQEETLGVIQRLRHDLTPDAEGEAEARQTRLSQWGAVSTVLREALPADGALIEYVRCTRLSARPWAQLAPPRGYVAFVWRAGAPRPVVIPLGDASAIDAAVAELTAALRDDEDAFAEDRLGTFAGSRTQTAASLVRALALDRALPAVGDARQLLLAPDGALSLVPFGLLPAPEGHLIDRFEVTYLSSGRDLVRPPAAPADGFQPPLVVADPDYGDGPMERLPGTRDEGEAVARMLGVEPSLDADANEGRVKAVRSPAILHIATHGWFLPDADGAELPDWAQLPRFAALLEEGVGGRLARSGLVLAGFNTFWTGGSAGPDGSNGLLTAGEASALDLTGTELVVLSACYTGLGYAADLEGVYGLRRGFAMAGARGIVMSMWPVPDEQTRDIMLAFYRRLLNGETRAAALREAQLEVRDGGAAHPFLWAAFALNGDPGPLAVATLAGLRDASPDVETQGDATQSAQIRLALEALRRGDVITAERRARPLAEAGAAEAMTVLAAVAQERDDDAEAVRWFTAAHAAGSSIAAYGLGLWYDQHGDEEAAEPWWTIAAEAGNAEAMYRVAAGLLERGDREAALRWWRAGADVGYPAAFYALGAECHKAGDLEEAEAWWRKAADADIPDAAYNLAALAGQRGDAAESERWYRRAAELGYPEAAKELAMEAYNAGRGDEAVDLWRAAAERGDVEAAHNAGVALQERNPIEAERWYRVAAATGFASSANNLGNLLESRGDVEGAKRAWQVAIDNGHARAPVWLGRMLLDEGDLETAEVLLRPAATAGDPSAAEALARLLERRGTPESDRWLHAAAQAGDPEAAVRLGDRFAEQGQQDEAFAHWRSAADAGSSAAGTRLGYVLASVGRHEEAEQWWSYGTEAGDADAALALAAARISRGDLEGARQAVMGAADNETAATLRLILAVGEPLLLSRAERGHGGAMFALARYAEVLQDAEGQDRWLRALAEIADPETLESVAIALDDEPLLEAATRRGRPRAARALAGHRHTPEALANADRLERAVADTEAGLAAYAAGDLVRAERLWRAAAAAGMVPAFVNLATLMLDGGEPEAERWLRLADEHGDPHAAAQMSLLAAEADDHIAARQWYARAVSLARGV